MNNFCSDKNIICFYHEYAEYGCFSNWYQAAFEYAGKTFTSIEQYMMYHKVLMFREYDLADKIMESNDPMEIKKLGRTKISSFDAKLWDNVSYAIVKRGIRAKFMQNLDLLNILLSTGNKVLSEASEKDKKWGIGVAVDNPRRYNMKEWDGNNYLGRILMEVRDELRFLPMKDLVYIDAKDLDFPEWHMSAGELKRIPKLHYTIKAYADTLIGDWERDCFYNQCEIYEWEVAMHTNMGGGLPWIGFWELKQDIYDLCRLK